jgi:hypothetical protein
VSEGKFFHPDLDALRDERKNAEQTLERIKKDMEKLNKRIQEAEAPVSGDKDKDKEEKK